MKASIFSFLPTLIPLISFYISKHANHHFHSIRTTWDQEYDYIIVGAGSAGSVLASRLSENPHLRILLLEAGGNENLISDIPIAYQHLQRTHMDWQYLTEPQEAACYGLNSRRSRWPRGKVLGGSSTLNVMLYVRGNRHDYDKWAQEGAVGWSWAEVFPYFLKSEDNRDIQYSYNGYHSVGGPLTIETPRFLTPLGHAWPLAGMHLGYQTIDINGPMQTGFAIPQGTTRHGARCSTAKAYLAPVQNRINLHVVTNAFVTKVIFDKHKRAVAVQFDHNKLPFVVFAKREIILSGGTVNSPHLLMLSGVGPAHHLKSLGIPVVSDLSVGDNLQDHIYSHGIHFTVNTPITLSQQNVMTPKNLIKYFKDGTGPLTSLGGVEGIGFIRTKYANTTHDWPDVEIHFSSGNVVADNGKAFRELYNLKQSIWQTVYSPYAKSHTFTLDPVLLRPKSRGFIRLRSSNPYIPPIINPRYLTHPDDIQTMIEGMKIAIAVGYSPAFMKFGAKLFDTVFPTCTHYDYLSDAYLACVARTFTLTIYHPVGTCKMGADWDPTAVVDTKLRVKGVKGLRVVDGSVMPNIISGNTNAPIIMIAERAADFIKGTLISPFSFGIHNFASSFY